MRAAIRASRTFLSRIWLLKLPFKVCDRRTAIFILEMLGIIAAPFRRH